MALSLKTDTADPKAATGSDAKPYIGKQENVIVEGGIYTPEVMWKIGLISGYAVSPDNKRIAYVVTYSSIEENTSHNVMHVMDADGKNDVLITTTTADEDSPQWIKGGTKIAFLSDVTGKDQIWEMNPDGTERKQLGHHLRQNGKIQTRSDFSLVKSRMLRDILRETVLLLWRSVLPEMQEKQL